MWAYWAWVYLVRGRVSNYDACVNAEGGVEENLQDSMSIDVTVREARGSSAIKVENKVAVYSPAARRKYLRT